MAREKLQGNKFKAVTKSDTVNFSYATTSNNAGAVLFVGTGGDLRILNEKGDDEVFKNISDGTFIPVNAVRVFATNTTADDIIAIW